MKTMNKIYLAALACGTLSLTACDDYLTSENTYQANQDTFFDSEEACEAALYPLYTQVWASFNEKFYYGIGDGRSNNLTARWSDYIYPYTNFTETSLSPGLSDAWGSFYSVVAQSNYAIVNIRDRATGITDDYRTRAIAECRFMRGVAYWYLASLWGKAIIYENTAEMVNNTVTPAHTREEAMEFAIRDLEFAAANLAKTSPAEGRINRYAAYAMLSRVYLSMAGLTTEGRYNGNNVQTNHDSGTRNTYYLDLAKKAALKVIEEGPYELLDNYGDLFSVAKTNNNSESIFQLQWIAGSTSAVGSDCTNPMPAFFSWSTMVGETNWGNATYASFDMVQTYDKKDRIRRHHTIATVGELYTHLNTKNGGYIYNETETGYDDKCNIVKYVIGKIDDNGQSYQQSSGLNTYMQRLPEVYFNYAEACMGNTGSTTDALALECMNKVRTRAGMPTLTSIDYKTLIYERRIELAYEGQYWYDLLRRSYYQQSEIIGYINNQWRNVGYEWDETQVCQYKAADGAEITGGDGVEVADVNRLLMPVSDVDAGRNPYLNEAPVTYFSAEQLAQPEVDINALFD